MSNQNTFNSQSTQNTLSNGGCPIMGSLNSMSDSKREEMMQMYESMISSGMHKPLNNAQNGDSQQSENSCVSKVHEMIQSSQSKEVVKYEEEKALCPMNKSNLFNVQSTSQRNIGGCPFFNKEITDPQGKNITQGYPLKYLSRMDFLFQPSGRKQLAKLKRNPKLQEFLNSLPWVLKHSLFLESKVLSQMREVEDIGQLFFITDDTKIKGNKLYDQGQYYQALDVYEQVLAVFTWLQFKDQSLKDRLYEDFNSPGIMDDDVEVIERRIVRESDRDFEKETNHSMIVGTLVNSMMAYSSMFHFDEALKCADFILDTYFQGPEIYYRKAQVIYFDKSHTIESLNEAIEMIRKNCIENPSSQAPPVKPKDKEKYLELEQKIHEEIEVIIQEEHKLLKMILKRAKRVIEKLKTKNHQQIAKDNLPNQSVIEMVEVLEHMDEKYPEIVQFFRDNQNGESSLQKAINEYQYFGRIYKQIKYVFNLKDPKSISSQVKSQLKPKYIEVLEDTRLHLVWQNVLDEITDSIYFHASELNQEIYNYAYGIYLDKQKKLKDRKQNEEEKKQDDDKKPNGGGMFSTSMLLGEPNRLIMINLGMFIVIAVIMFYFGWSVEWINERHITSWLRSIFRNHK